MLLKHLSKYRNIKANIGVKFLGISYMAKGAENKTFLKKLEKQRNYTVHEQSPKDHFKKKLFFQFNR